MQLQMQILYKIKATISNNMTDQVQNHTMKRHKKPSKPNIRTTESFTKVMAFQETMNVPDIDIVKKLQKQRSAAPRASDKVKAPVPTPNKAMDGTSELAAAIFHNVKEDGNPKTQSPSPPTTLSKVARKNQKKKKKREADQKERERKAAEIDSAIASNRGAD
jgi:cell envelope opacity-associated protein A